MYVRLAADSIRIDAGTVYDYTYNYRNRLDSVTYGGTTVDYVYNPDGIRVQADDVSSVNYNFQIFLKNYSKQGFFSPFLPGTEESGVYSPVLSIHSDKKLFAEY